MRYNVIYVKRFEDGSSFVRGATVTKKELITLLQDENTTITKADIDTEEN